MATEPESLDDDSYRAIEILKGAKRAPRDPDSELAEQLTALIGSPIEAEALRRLVADENSH